MARFSQGSSVCTGESASMKSAGRASCRGPGVEEGCSGMKRTV